MIFSLKNNKDSIPALAEFVAGYLIVSEHAKGMPVDVKRLEEYIGWLVDSPEVEIVVDVNDAGGIRGTIGVFVEQLSYNHLFWGYDLFVAAKSSPVAVRLMSKVLAWFRDDPRVAGATFGVTLGIDNDRAGRFLKHFGMDEMGRCYRWKKV